jgi:hypothetical protein
MNVLIESAAPRYRSRKPGPEQSDDGIACSVPARATSLYLDASDSSYRSGRYLRPMDSCSHFCQSRFEEPFIGDRRD